MIKTIFKKDDFKIRTTDIKDAGLVLDFIKQIAVYEKLEHEVVADIKSIEDSIYKKKEAYVLIAEVGDKPVGYMLYFLNYSTFIGKANLYLEDLFIDEAYRHQGYGKMMFKTLVGLAKNKGYKRIDWMCLKWNVNSRTFYESIGAKEMDAWVTYRLDEEGIALFK